MSMVAQVRADAEWVMNRAQWITVNLDKIAPYTASLLEKYLLTTALGSDNHADSVEYVVALDAINFGSGYFHVAQKAGIALEYSTIAQGLKKSFLAGKMVTPQQWSDSTAAQCHDIFSIPAGAHTALDGLMQLFAAHLNEAGKFILADYGDVRGLLDAAEGSAVRLVDILAQWPTFRDVTLHEGRAVAILKRAQIMAADINLVKGNDFFGDIAELTCFADNMVPHVLRHDGILTYHPDLAAKIDAGVMIESGSAQETELRCAAIHAVELMKQAAGNKVTSVNLDHILWHRGYEPDIYARPTHRTMSVWY